MRLKLIIIFPALLTLMLLVSCSGISRVPSFVPHKMDIRQGNMVTPEMRSKLKVGLSRAQASAVLGTPLVNDALHANRWDYVYRLEQDRKLIQQQSMTVFFDGDVVARIEDGSMPLLPPMPALPAMPALPPDAISAVTVPIESAPVAAVPAEIEIAPESPVAEAQPVAEAVPVVIAAIPVEQQVADAVDDWAAAWAAQDVTKYLAHYSLDFKPADGSSRAVWESQRRKTLARAKNIQLRLSDIKVSVQAENRASVNFKQSYRADNYTDAIRKTLELEKIGDEWLIVSEKIAGK